MLTAAFLVATSLQAQTPAPPSPPSTAESTTERAAAAAERAAAAAEKAAEASSRMAAAVERLTEALGKAPTAGAATPPEAAPAEKKDTVFTQDAEAIPNVLGESRLLVNTTSKLTVGLSESLSISTSFVLQYDSAPAPGKVTTDTALSANVQVSF